MKFKLIFLFLFFNAAYCWGQLAPNPKISTPNVASMERFGDIPVSLYTGVPSISIPVYEYKKGNIDIPITLAYHPGNVRVGQFAGWVGTGWNLSAEACITRKIKQSPDEWTWNNFISYYPVQAGVVSGSEKVATTDLTNPTKLNDFFTSVNNQFPDVCADEFSFNVCGYSGKFYYDGSSSSWKVISDQQPIKIDLLPTPFLSKSILDNVLRQHNITLMSLSSRMPELIFAGFVITLPNGTKCYFGGTDAIDFSSDFLLFGDDFTMMATAWHLNKIVDIYGNEVNFNYKRAHPTYQLGLFASESSNIGTRPTGGGSLVLCGGTGGTMNVSVSGYVNGNFEYPVYLTSISNSNDSVIFNSSASGCQKLTEQVYSTLRAQTATFVTSYIILGDNYRQTDPNIQWEQLDSITVKTNNSISGKFKFGFSNSPSQRLTLNSFQVVDKNNGNSKKYLFEYNNIQKLPLPIGDSTDHWGFCNNKTVVGKPVLGIYPYRESNPDVVTTGLLTKITYPTGGYSTFKWEAHNYNKVVSKTKDTVYAASGWAGGCRINEINGYTSDNNMVLHKRYLYKKNYAAGSNEATLLSSGTLNGMPVYYMSINDRPSYHQPFSYSLNEGAINSLGCYSDAGDMSYIGYDEVVEINQDGSYTKNFFTCYDQDLFGNTHFDSAPIGVATWRRGDDAYFPMNSIARERGKPVGIFDYSATNILLQKQLIQYRNDAGRFNSYQPYIDYRGSIQCTSYDAVNFVTANKEYTYSYYPIKKQIISYDQNGNNPLTQTELYSYNSYNQITNKTSINSKQDSIRTVFKYPQDYSDAVSQKMVTNNIISPLIEETVSAAKELSKAKTNYGSWYNNTIIAPATSETSVAGNVLEKQASFDQYDAHGNLLQFTDRSGIVTSFLWGYNYSYPVAKITGIDYATIALTVNPGTIQSLTDDSLRSALAPLRSLSNGFVTTYTYMPLVGITSETNINGRTIYYEYDGLNRLQLIRDHDNNIVKTFCYNFAGQPEDCSIKVYTSVKSQVFTKNNCTGGTVGTDVTYTVTITSTISQADADSKAQADMNTKGQNYANANGICVFKSTQSQTFSRNNCGSCSTGNSVLYTATATSTVSQADADSKAQADINLNGQNYANQNGTCTLNNNPTSLNPGSQTSLSSFSASTSNNVLTMSLIFYPTIDITPGAPFQVGTLSNSCYNSYSGSAVVTPGGITMQLICDRGKILVQSTSQTIKAYTTINISPAVLLPGSGGH
ncbi:DUF5977 domain-containing protein [Chitinophaga sp. RAB17]|uniref:DUF5977 domain-containing protein n=1 Tax=Chitinophaga sp. RAB17 TaxID=3233049 RepID=UPI003F92EF61